MWTNTYTGQAYASATLVTDTVAYDVVSHTAKTIKVRRRAVDSTRPAERDALVDQGPYPVVWLPTVSLPDAEVQTLRLRKDGTYRLASWANPLRFSDDEPQRRVDYRV